MKATDGKVARLGKDLLGMKQEEWRDVRSDIQMIFQIRWLRSIRV